MTNEEIVEKLTETESRSKSNTHQIAEIKQKQDNLDKLVSSVAVMATEQEHIKDDVKEIKTDVKALTDKPAKRWDGLMDKLLFAAAGAFIAWIASGAPGLN